MPLYEFSVLQEQFHEEMSRTSIPNAIMLFKQHSLEFQEKFEHPLQHDQAIILSRCVLLYVSHLKEIYSNASHTGSIKIAMKQCLSVIPDLATVKGARDLLMKTLFKPLLSEVVKVEIDMWFSKELLSIVNAIASDSTMHLRHKLAEKNRSLVLKLMEWMRVCGDYELQVSIIGLIYRLCSTAQIHDCASKSFLNASQAASFSTFDRKNQVEYNIRQFLNKVNAVHKRVHSFQSDIVYVGNTLLSGPDYGEGQPNDLWVDFNPGLSQITICCNKDSLRTTIPQTSSPTSQWEMVTIPFEIVLSVTSTLIHEEDIPRFTTFKFSLEGACEVVHESSKEAVSAATAVKIVVASGKDSLRIQNVLTDLFKDKFVPHQKPNIIEILTGSSTSDKGILSAAHTMRSENTVYKTFTNTINSQLDRYFTALQQKVYSNEIEKTAAVTPDSTVLDDDVPRQPQSLSLPDVPQTDTGRDIFYTANDAISATTLVTANSINPDYHSHFVNESLTKLAGHISGTLLDKGPLQRELVDSEDEPNVELLSPIGSVNQSDDKEPLDEAFDDGLIVDEEAVEIEKGAKTIEIAENERHHLGPLQNEELDSNDESSVKLLSPIGSDNKSEDGEQLEESVDDVLIVDEEAGAIEKGAEIGDISANEPDHIPGDISHGEDVMEIIAKTPIAIEPSTTSDVIVIDSDTNTPVSLNFLEDCTIDVAFDKTAKTTECTVIVSRTQPANVSIQQLKPVETIEQIGNKQLSISDTLKNGRMVEVITPLTVEVVSNKKYGPAAVAQIKEQVGKTREKRPVLGDISNPIHSQGNLSVLKIAQPKNNMKKAHKEMPDKRKNASNAICGTLEPKASDPGREHSPVDWKLRAGANCFVKLVPLNCSQLLGISVTKAGRVCHTPKKLDAFDCTRSDREDSVSPIVGGRRRMIKRAKARHWNEKQRFNSSNNWAGSGASKRIPTQQIECVTECTLPNVSIYDSDKENICVNDASALSIVSQNAKTLARSVDKRKTTTTVGSALEKPVKSQKRNMKRKLFNLYDTSYIEEIDEQLVEPKRKIVNNGAENKKKPAGVTRLDETLQLNIPLSNLQTNDGSGSDLVQSKAAGEGEMGGSADDSSQSGGESGLVVTTRVCIEPIPSKRKQENKTEEKPIQRKQPPIKTAQIDLDAIQIVNDDRPATRTVAKSKTISLAQELEQFQLREAAEFSRVNVATLQKKPTRKGALKVAKKRPTLALIEKDGSDLDKEVAEITGRIQLAPAKDSTPKQIAAKVKRTEKRPTKKRNATKKPSRIVDLSSSDKDGEPSPKEELPKMNLSYTNALKAYRNTRILQKTKYAHANDALLRFNNFLASVEKGSVPEQTWLKPTRKQNSRKTARKASARKSDVIMRGNLSENESLYSENERYVKKSRVRGKKAEKSPLSSAPLEELLIEKVTKPITPEFIYESPPAVAEVEMIPRPKITVLKDIVLRPKAIENHSNHLKPNQNTQGETMTAKYHEVIAKLQKSLTMLSNSSLDGTVGQHSNNTEPFPDYIKRVFRLNMNHYEEQLQLMIQLSKNNSDLEEVFIKSLILSNIIHTLSENE